MGDRAVTPISPRAVFDEAFPYYLAIGMPYELYWDGEPRLAVHYRKADILRQQRSNNDAWLQGVYFRMAVASTLDKKAKYPKEPFKLQENKNVDGKMNAKQEKAKAALMVFAERFNQKMHSDAMRKGGVTNA